MQIYGELLLSDQPEPPVDSYLTVPQEWPQYSSTGTSQ